MTQFAYAAMHKFHFHCLTQPQHELGVKQKYLGINPIPPDQECLAKSRQPGNLIFVCNLISAQVK